MLRVRHPARLTGPAVERADEAGPYRCEGGLRQYRCERVEHRLRSSGMEGPVHREAFVRGAPVIERGAHPVHVRDGTGQHLGAFPVGHGELQAGLRGGELCGPLPLQCYRHHGARHAVIPHQTAPMRAEFQTVRERQRPGGEERRVLTDAVARHGPGADARLVPQPDQSALQGEQGRLRGRCRPDGPRCARPLGEESGQHRFTGETAMPRLAGVEDLTHDGKPFVQGRRRSGAEGTLAGELEHHSGGRAPRRHGARGGRERCGAGEPGVESIGQRGRCACPDRDPVPAVRAPEGGGRDEIRQGQSSPPAEHVAQGPYVVGEGFPARRGDQKHVRRGRGGGTRPGFGGFLKDQVDVGAADPERRDTRPPGVPFSGHGWRTRGA